MTIWKFEVYGNNNLQHILCCKVVARGDNEELARRQAESYAKQHPNHAKTLHMKSCGLASASEAKYLSEEEGATQIMYRPMPILEGID